MSQRKGERRRARRLAEDQEERPSSVAGRIVDAELLAAVLLRAEPGLRQATRRRLVRSGWAFAPRHLPCPS
ncbi:MAG: hypothetical protein IPG96_08505 [Proteobacteria bacterium]|nr:hypothetical protein [Pseudomonadota bacterium]